MRNILVVGASSTIAKSLIQDLSDQDVSLFSISRQETDVESSNHMIADVTDPGSLLELPCPLHGIVYFPGTLNLKPFSNLCIDDFIHDMNVNFFGLVNVLNKYEKNLKEAENSSIVVISSVAASVGIPFHTSISAAKAALEGFARSFASEYAPKVRINIIAPTLTDTNLTKHLLDQEGKKDEFCKRHPLKRVASPKDIVNAINFLL